VLGLLGIVVTAEESIVVSSCLTCCCWLQVAVVTGGAQGISGIADPS
jgi:hypothetical protein